MKQAITYKVVWSFMRTNAKDRGRSLGAGGPDNSHQHGICSSMKKIQRYSSANY